MGISIKKSISYFVSIALAGLVLSTAVSAQHEASDSIMVFSGELIANRQLVEAESVLSEAIWDDAEYAPLYIQRGIVYGMQTKFKQAIPDFTKGIELDPKMPEAYYSRGLAYKKTKDFDNALKDYNKAIELNPEYADAFYNRGLIFYSNENYDGAFNDFTKAVKINSNYAKAYYNLGLIYNTRAAASYNAKDSSGYLDNYKLEVENYDRAININPKYTDAVYNRGLAFLKLRELEKAEKDFKRAIFLNPKFREARFNLGVTYEKMRQYGDAKKQFEIYLKNAPEVDSLRVKELKDKFPQMEKWQNRIDSVRAEEINLKDYGEVMAEVGTAIFFYTKYKEREKLQKVADYYKKRAIENSDKNVFVNFFDAKPAGVNWNYPMSNILMEHWLAEYVYSINTNRDELRFIEH